MPAMTKPMGGALPGSIVEVDGKLAQVVDYAADAGAVSVMTVDGVSDQVPVSKLKVPELAKPGQGGDSDSFDILVGPKLAPSVLGEEIATCLMEKGFCVVKTCGDPAALLKAVELMRELSSEGKLERLPEEVESGYLGVGGKGAVVWLDDSKPDSLKDAAITASDDFLSNVVYSLLPYSMNTFGVVAENRTPALLSLSLQAGQEAEFPPPFADQATLGSYLKSWKRSCLRAVHFMGPNPASVVLEKKDSLPMGDDVTSITAGANTIVLFRPGCIEFNCTTSEETLSMSVIYMESETKLEYAELPALDSSLLGELMTGPPPPASDEGVWIEHTATRMAGNWDDSPMYHAGLTGGCDCGVEMPFSRFDYQPYYTDTPETLQPWQMSTKHMGFVEGLERFDNKYFNIPAAEAASTDTMHRHTLETAAMALAKKGITKKVSDREPRHAGFSIGLDKDDWVQIPDLCPAANQGGQNVQAILANRVSYTFNLKGASFTGDTACSSSLTVAYLGRVKLQDRDINKLEFHLAMGLHQCLVVGYFIGNSQGHMTSVIGRCSTFNASADGYMRGDGCSGMIMTWGNKSADMECMFRGCQIGQNGRSATMTAPNGLAQEDVIMKTCREAVINVGASQSWSCHGTGTSLGDPIEVGAIRKISNKNDRVDPLIVNTNKTNTGHLEGGAAMTSLIAAVFQVTSSKGSAVIHLNQLNPHLENENFASYFASEISPTNTLQSHKHISSFGFGGTNAHAIYWAENKYQIPDPSLLFRKKLSAMKPAEVRAVGSDPSDWDTDLPDDVKPGDMFEIPLDSSEDASMKYVKMEEGLDEDVDEDDIAYSIVGSFNDWTPEMMEAGDVPGQKTIMVEVPSSGQINFRFVQTVDEDMVLAPTADNCMKKTAPIVGPMAGLSNAWTAMGTPGSFIRIDLFTSFGRKGVMWLAA